MYKSLDYVTMDLLQKLLNVNPKTRIRASEALQHPYFDADRIEKSPFMISEMSESGAMIDEKDEDLSTVSGKSKRYERMVDSSSRSHISSGLLRKNSLKGTVFEEKENNLFDFGMSKKNSLFQDLDLVPIRRSKRTCMQDKKCFEKQIRF